MQMTNKMTRFTGRGRRHISARIVAPLAVCLPLAAAAVYDIQLRTEIQLRDASQLRANTQIVPNGTALRTGLAIDPNSAPWYEFTAIPGIGDVKAHAIVEYRTEHAPHTADGRAFRQTVDLENVYGIGPKTAEKMRRFLVFN